VKISKAIIFFSIAVALLAAIMMTKGVTLGLAVSTMAINMALKGVPDSLGIMIPFLVITTANLVMTVIMLKNVKE